jgi:acetolactate synthase regulatory subunit
MSPKTSCRPAAVLSQMLHFVADVAAVAVAAAEEEKKVWQLEA